MTNINVMDLTHDSVKMSKLITSQAKEWDVDISSVDFDRFLIYCMDRGKHVHFSSREENEFSYLQKELGIEGECRV